MIHIEAFDEKRITPLELIQEIIPLLEETFHGIFDINKKSITYTMPNGQKFRISVCEANLPSAICR